MEREGEARRRVRKFFTINWKGGLSGFSTLPSYVEENVSNISSLPFKRIGFRYLLSSVVLPFQWSIFKQRHQWKRGCPPKAEAWSALSALSLLFLVVALLGSISDGYFAETLLPLSSFQIAMWGSASLAVAETSKSSTFSATAAAAVAATAMGMAAMGVAGHPQSAGDVDLAVQGRETTAAAAAASFSEVFPLLFAEVHGGVDAPPQILRDCLVQVNGGHLTVAPDWKGRFFFSLPVGSHVVEVEHPQLLFSAARVDVKYSVVTSKKRPKAERMGEGGGAGGSGGRRGVRWMAAVTAQSYTFEKGGGGVMALPLRLVPVGKIPLFIQQESFYPLKFLRSPMVLLGLVSMAFLFCLPNLQEMLDPAAAGEQCVQNGHVGHREGEGGRGGVDRGRGRASSSPSLTRQSSTSGRREGGGGLQTEFQRCVEESRRFIFSNGAKRSMSNDNCFGSGVEGHRGGASPTLRNRAPASTAGRSGSRRGGSSKKTHA